MLISTLIVINKVIPTAVWVIGIALALLRWRRHPRISQFALIAFVLLICDTIIVRTMYIWAPLAMMDLGRSDNETGKAITAIGIASTGTVSTWIASTWIVSALINAAAWALVIYAIFGWRDQSRKENLSLPASPAAGNEPR